MAFFKFRPGANAGSEESASGAETPSVDLLRRKARQRLIGATVLVVLAVAGFPMVFDTQPRPVPVDLSIDIPSKVKASPDVPPEPLKPGSGATPSGTTAVSSAADDAKHSLSEKEEWVASNAADKPSTAASSPSAPTPKADSAPAASADNKSAAEKPREEASEPRFVVQVGAYTDEAKVREVRAKLEKAGLKTYVQVIDTKDGKRTRVRVGPFPNRTEAEKVAEKAKSLQLQAAILTY